MSLTSGFVFFQLLKTQADLQKTQSDLTEQRNLANDFSEQNRQLKTENETILRNQNRDKLNIEAEHGDTIAQISNFQREILQRDESLTELRISLEESSIQVVNLETSINVFNHHVSMFSGFIFYFSF